MIKQTLYPKTSRMTANKGSFIITEKIDGSNLGFFKLDGKLFIAQKNNTYTWTEMQEMDRQPCYKGLYGWLTEHAEELENSIGNGQIIFGEWLGMRPIVYGEDYGKYTMFAKGRIDENFVVTKLHYNPENLKYGFFDSKDENDEYHIPSCVGIVKVVKELDVEPDQMMLDELYDDYCEEVERMVEGFIVIGKSQNIVKYVRVKDGRMMEHVSNRYKNYFEHLQGEMMQRFNVSRETLIGDMTSVGDILTLISINPRLINLNRVNELIKPEMIDVVVDELKIIEEMSGDLDEEN